MARKISTVDAPKAGTTTLVVPEDVAQELATIYADLSANKGKQGYVEFDGDKAKSECNEWKNQAKFWATQKGLIFRQLPSAHLGVEDGVHALRFQITTPKPASNGNAK